MKKIASLTLALTLTAPGLFTGCRDTSGPTARDLLFPPEVINPVTVAEVHTIFEELDYSWRNFDGSIPHILFDRLPTDIDTIRSTPKRKQLFFLMMLPMVLAANDEIEAERQTLFDIFEKIDGGIELGLDEKSQLQAFADRYRIKGDIFSDTLLRQRLLKRVDTIPPSLVLAQAANESAYGTSRFALEANNLFGEWTFTPGTGLVPKSRPAGAKYEVRLFNSLLDSIRSYLNNLNSHPAYRKLRNLRKLMRDREKTVTGTRLAAGLSRYSARGDEYIEEIRNMIWVNGLEDLAGLTLRVPERLRRYSRPEVPPYIARAEF